VTAGSLYCQIGDEYVAVDAIQAAIAEGYGKALDLCAGDAYMTGQHALRKRAATLLKLGEAHQRCAQLCVRLFHASFSGGDDARAQDYFQQALSVASELTQPVTNASFPVCDLTRVGRFGKV
jgi:hypothetical protein